MRKISFNFKKIWMMGIFVFGVLFTEFFYYCSVYSKTTIVPAQGYDLVLTYTGSIDVEKAIHLALSKNVPLFISGADQSGKVLFRAQSILGNSHFIDDPRAFTTDQNARYTAPYLCQKGYRQVLLLTPWEHLPRALFLTRLYLIGSQVHIIPCANSPAPPDWWRYGQAWKEFFKFWGSIGRIVLHWFGINDWPPPEWMPLK